MDNLSDAELDARYNAAILKADPSKLSDQELDRRLSLREQQKTSAQENFLQKAGRYAGNVASAVNENVIKPVATVLDYPQAIVRQGLVDPSQILKQAMRNPNQAPTGEQVLNKYGVPSEMEVPDTYDAGPPQTSSQNILDQLEGNTKTINPAQRLATTADLAVGGNELGLLAKGIGKGANIVGKGIESGEGIIGKSAGLLSKAVPEYGGSLQKESGLLPDHSISADRQLNGFSQIEQKLAKSGKTDQALPSAERLNQIEKILPDMEYGPLDLHKEMLKSKSSMDELRTLHQELPSKNRDLLDRYNQAMKSEIGEKLTGEAQKFAPDLKDATKAGDEFMSHVDDIYNSNKKNLGPLFKELQGLNLPREKHIDSLVQSIAQSAPELANALQITEDGSLAIKPYSGKMGMSQKEYSMAKDVVNDINSGDLSFKDMQNMRETLRKEIDPINPKQTRVLEGIRKGMLDHMNTLVDAYYPEGTQANVRTLFKDWAVNEKNMSGVADVIGGKAGGFDEALKANPSKVLDRIFATPQTFRAASQYINPEQMKELQGQWLNSLVSKSMDSAKNTFSSSKLAQILKTQGPVIQEFSPETYQRMSALADLAKIVPDMPSVNPSGTAKTLVQMLKQPHGIVGDIAENIKNIHSQNKATEKVGGLLKTKKGLVGE